mmetsp:Transcript_10749/g.14027  ORF Transcript_10749/g.14027 Transcript_10749/m.14027 type:complete len:269 (-) Transcript_10749:337-1143(-)
MNSMPSLLIIIRERTQSTRIVVPRDHLKEDVCIVRRIMGLSITTVHQRMLHEFITGVENHGSSYVRNPEQQNTRKSIPLSQHRPETQKANSIESTVHGNFLIPISIMNQRPTHKPLKGNIRHETNVIIEITLKKRNTLNIIRPIRLLMMNFHMMIQPKPRHKPMHRLQHIYHRPIHPLILKYMILLTLRNLIMRQVMKLIHTRNEKKSHPIQMHQQRKHRTTHLIGTHVQNRRPRKQVTKRNKTQRRHMHIMLHRPIQQLLTPKFPNR